MQKSEKKRSLQSRVLLKDQNFGSYFVEMLEDFVIYFKGKRSLWWKSE